MGRWKVPMEPINNDKKRNLAFRTRKKGIFKKALELTTLCDVNVSMIICNDHQEPEIFPPDPHKFTSLMDHYRRTRIMDPGKIRYYSLSDFFKEKTMKVEEELAKAKKNNLEAKYPTWFDFLNNFSEVQLREFAAGLGSKIDDVKNKVESLKNISKIQNQDNNTNYPTTVLNIQSSSIMPSLNPFPGDYDDVNFDHEELSDDEDDEPCPEDYDDIIFDQEELLSDESNDNNHPENFSLQSSQPPYCFPQEMVQQPQPPSSSDQNNFILQSSNTNSTLKLKLSIDNIELFI